MRMRNSLQDRGFNVYGQPSPIVPLVIGNVGIMRICARLLLENGFIVNPVEHPAVPKGTARYRLQMMASHTNEQIDQFIELVTICHEKAKEIIANMPQQTAKAITEMQVQPKL